MKRLANAVIVTTCLLAGHGIADEVAPTFSDDVAAIVHQKCTICHRPGSSAPFTLISYDDVRRRAGTIEAVLDSGYMPPWKPVDHGISFANARDLSSDEETTLRRWIAADCPSGDLRRAPSPPEFADGWSLGKPDLVVKMNGTYRVPADGPDIYRSFVFPLQLSDDKWVKAVELRPTAKTAVHHAIFLLDSSGAARKLDGADGQAGLEGMGLVIAGERQNKPGEAGAALGGSPLGGSGLGGYVPGSTPNVLPGDLAMPLPAGSDIVMQTHFHPSGKEEFEQAELALYFAETAPSRQLVPVMLPPMFGFGSGIRIPAGESNYEISDSFTLPVDAQAIQVSGHAHYLCREMKLTAKLPSGESLVLLHIDDWDLDWQDQYLFADAIDLPAGTVLHSELRYDNSEGNPENPHFPPRDVRWGRGSTDEMGSITLMTVAATERRDGRLATVDSAALHGLHS